MAIIPKASRCPMGVQFSFTGDKTGAERFSLVMHSDDAVEFAREILEAAAPTAPAPPSPRRPVAGWEGRRECYGTVTHRLTAGPFICWATVDPDDSEVAWSIESNGGMHTETGGARATLEAAKLAAEDAALGLLRDAINALRGGR